MRESGAPQQSCSSSSATITTRTLTKVVALAACVEATCLLPTSCSLRELESRFAPGSEKKNT